VLCPSRLEGSYAHDMKNDRVKIQMPVDTFQWLQGHPHEKFSQ
jgi:hypothetical protein